MLCLLTSLNLGNSKLLVKGQCQKWLLRVWNNCIPGCAREGILYSLMHTYTEIRADTGVGRHSTRHTQGLFLRPKPETSGGGSPRFAFGGKSKFYEVHLGFMYANVILYGERL